MIRHHYGHRELRSWRALLVVLVLLGAGFAIHALHGYQVRHHAGYLLTLVDRCEQAGDLDGVDRHLGSYVRLVPGDIDAQARWALRRSRRAVTARAKLDAAILLQRVVAQDPSRTDARITLGRLLVEIGRYGEAIDQIVELQKAQPKEPELVRLLVQAEMGRSQYAKAAAACRRAIQLDPSDIASYILFAELLRDRLEKPADADAVMNKLVAAHPQSPDAHLARARYRLKYQDRDAGRVDVATATEIAPDHVGALQLAAEIATSDGDYTEARKHLQKALTLAPGEADLYLSLCSIDMSENHIDKAIDTIRQGMQESPDARLSWTLADLLTRDGQRDEAMWIIERLAGPGRATPAVDYLRAGLLRERGDYLQAARLYERIVGRLGEIPDLDVQAEYFLGDCYRVIGLSDQAGAQFRRVIRLRPRWSQPRWSLAGELAANGRFREALAECESARQLGPLTARQYALYLTLHVWQQQLRPVAKRSWETCDQLRQEALQAWPESPEVLSATADFLGAKGRAQDAIDWLAGAAQQHPQLRDLRIALAALYDRVGRAEDARVTLEEAERALGDSVSLRLARANRLDGNDSPAKTLQGLAADAQQFPQAERLVLLRGLGLAASRLGQWELAQEYFDQLAKLAEYDVSPRMLLFDLALRAKDDAALQRSVEEIRAIEGPRGAVWRVAEASRLMVATEAAGGKAFARVRELLEEARAQNPNWAKVHLAIARLEDMQNRPDRAVEAYQTAVEFGEHQPEVLRRLILLLTSEGRYQDADRTLRKLEEDAAIPVELYPITTEVAFRARDYQGAAEQARRYVAAQPHDYRSHLWLGVVLNALGRTDEAETALREGSHIAPEEIGAWLPLVVFLARSGKSQEARDAISQAQAGLPADRVDRGLAACFEAIGDIEQAEAHYRAAVAAQPQDTAILLGAADFYGRQQRLGDAETHLRRVLQIEPQKRPARRGLALVLQAKTDYPSWREAIKHIETNLKEDPTSRDDRRVKAVLLAARPSTRLQQEAIKILEELAAAAAIGPDDRHLLAQLYFAHGHASKGRDQMVGLLAQYPDNRDYLTTFVQSLLDRGDARQAETWLRRLEERDPKSAETIALKIRLLAATNKRAEARLLIQQRAEELVVEDKNLPLIIDLGRLCESIGEVNEAGDVYRRCYELRPEGALPLSAWLAQQDRIEEAVQVLDAAWEQLPADQVAIPAALVAGSEKASAVQQRHVESRLLAALEKHDRSIPLLLALAWLRDSQGQYREAVTIYEEVLQLDPQHLYAMNSLAWLLSQCQGDHSAALVLVERAIEQYGPSARLLDTRGVIFAGLGELPRAVQDLEEAYANAPQPNIAFHLAQAYHQAGQLDRARQVFRDAKDPKGVLPQLHASERASFQRLVAALQKGSPQK